VTDKEKRYAQGEGSTLQSGWSAGSDTSNKFRCFGYL